MPYSLYLVIVYTDWIELVVVVVAFVFMLKNVYFAQWYLLLVMIKVFVRNMKFCG